MVDEFKNPITPVHEATIWRMLSLGAYHRVAQISFTVASNVDNYNMILGELFGKLNLGPGAYPIEIRDASGVVIYETVIGMGYGWITVKGKKNE